MQKTIMMTINENYLDQVAVAISGLLEHNPSEHIMVFHTPGVQAGFLTKAFGEKVEIVMLEPDDTSWFPNGTFNQKTVEGMCLRLKALDYLMEHRPELDRVLYLDSDIIVESYIGDVWGGPVHDKFVAGALDFPSLPELYEVYRHHPDWNRRIAINRNYFNSGVMLLNMKKLSEHYKGKVASGFREMYDGTWFLPDQDYLNIILTKGCPSVILPRPFNFMIEMQCFTHLSASMLIKGRDQATRMAKVLHFAGNTKPWMTYNNMLLPDERFMQLRFDRYWNACKACKERTDGLFPSGGFMAQVQENHERFKFIGMMLGDLV